MCVGYLNKFIDSQLKYASVVHNNRFCKNHEKIPIQSGPAIHAFSVSPTQFAPLPKGAGFVQVLLWV